MTEKMLLIRIGNAMRIAGNLPAAIIGTPYSQTLTAVDGTGPYQFALVSETVTDAITLTDNGNGTATVAIADPAAAGLFEIVVSLRDSTRRTITRTFPLRVISLPLAVSGSLDAATVGSAYSDTLTVSNGVGPYSLASATLPAGLNAVLASGTITISGTPTSGHGIAAGGSGTFALSVTVTDSDGGSATYTQSLSLSVPALVITATSLPDAEAGAAYVGLFTITGGVGTGYQLNTFAGLPDSLSAAFDSPNEIDVTGTPDYGTDTGSPYSLSIEVEDGEGNIATLTPDLVVGEPIDPDFAYVVSLLHFDGANGATTVTDEIGVVWSVSDSKIDTSTSVFGGSSLWNDFANGGIGRVVSTDSTLAPGTADFVVEGWVRFVETSTTQIIFDQRSIGSNTEDITLYMISGNLRFFANGADRITGATALSAGVDYFIRLSRAGGTTRLYVNTTQQGSDYADSNTYAVAGGRTVIGASSLSSSGTFAVEGWLDDWRITIGSGRAATNGVVPTAPFPDAGP